MEAAPRHFAYRAAEEVLRRFPSEKLYTVEAGVTPSGKIHLGNFIDIVLADSVMRALESMGVEAEGYLAVDSMDPFRQPPTFAPEGFQREADQYVGKPFERIPDPWDCHKSYAQHFVEPVEKSFEAYGVGLRIKWASELHRDRGYVNYLLEALRRAAEVVEILNEVKKEAGHAKLYPKGWIPYRPLCASCWRIDEVVKPIEVTEHLKVRYRCDYCSYEGEADPSKAEGKPPWRVDWPLRWLALSVHFEPLGKDHMASGSGYDTGCALAKRIFNREPPIPVFYDFVYFIKRENSAKVYAKFSKRKGVGLGIDEWLRYAPPEVLRFQFLKKDSSNIFEEALSHWDFEFEQIPSYVEEFDRFEEQVFNNPNPLLQQTYRLTMSDGVPARAPKRVSYYQLARVAAWMENLEDGLKMLERQGKLQGLEEWELVDVKKRLEMAWEWLKIVGYSAVLQDPAKALEAVKALKPEAVQAFVKAASEIVENRFTDVNECVRKAAEEFGLTGREERLHVYRVFYRSLLGEDSGPPLRRLISRPEVIELLKKIIEKLEINSASSL